MDCRIAFLAVILLVARVEFVEARHKGGGDFMAWVGRVGERHELKSKGGVVPGDMTWLDWKAKEVTSKSYIVVDQNGGGDFRNIIEAVDSIQRDMYRPYRITIQINPGFYR